MRDRSPGQSLGAYLGPEIVALVLAALVLFGVAVLNLGLLTGRPGSSPGASPVPSPSGSISPGG
jgi:hypothetical protein